MIKQEFLDRLREGLSALPQEEIDEQINFYAEIIDDRIEDGLSEEQAVLQAGNVEDIIMQIKSDFSDVHNTASERKLKVWQIILIALGSPIWFSLIVAVVCIVFSLYVSLWSIVISFWAVFASVVAFFAYGIIAGTVFAFSSHVLVGLVLFGGGLFCAGLSVFLFFGCKAATLGTVLLTKIIALGFKKLFCKKERA